MARGHHAGAASSGHFVPVLPPSQGDDLVLFRFVRELQVLAGDLADGSPAELAVRLRRAVERLPGVLSPVAWWTVRGLASETVARLLRRGCFAASELELRRAVAAAPSPGALLDLLIHALRVAREHPPGAPPIEARVERAVAYIRANCTRPSLVLEDVSRHVRLSQWHLSRLLVRHTGSSYREVLRRARMEEAGRLLREETLSVKEVSARLGYPHPTELDRQFKQSFGMTPTEWRARAPGAPKVPAPRPRRKPCQRFARTAKTPLRRRVL